MSEIGATDLVVTEPALAGEGDQASGLRRLFERIPAQWTLVLQPVLRPDSTAEALADRAEFGRDFVGNRRR